MIVSPRHAFGLALWFVAGLALVYILAPLAVIVAASFGETGYVQFPPQGFTLRWYAAALAAPRYLSGFVTSLWLAALVTAIATAIGAAAAWALARREFRGRQTIEGLLLAPLLLPGLILAVALTIFFARFPFLTGTWRLVAAHLTICIPCVIRVAMPALKRLDPALEEAARNLGASPFQAFLLVVLPAVRPAILAAAAFAFILSFDEVEMALFLASPRAAPLTVVLYGTAQYAFEPTLAAVSGLLIGLTFVAMLASQMLRRR
jgi:putative spermidine/putrescine transport system permease protein